MIPFPVTLAKLLLRLIASLENKSTDCLLFCNRRLFWRIQTISIVAICSLITNSVLWAQYDWVPIGDSSTSVSYGSIVFDGDDFVAVGEGSRYAISPDGVNWETRIIESAKRWGFQMTRLRSSEIGSHAIFDIFGSGGYLLAEDPVDWILPEFTSSRGYVDVAYGSGAQVLLHQSINSVHRIPDGSNAGNDIKLSSRCKSIVFGNGLFVVCGKFGKIYTSPTGTSWTEQVTNTVSDLERINFVEDEFLVVGNDGTFLRSSDGVSWESLSTGGAEPFFDVSKYRGHYYLLTYGSSPVLRFDLSGNFEDLGLLEARVSGIAVSSNRIVLCGAMGSLIHSEDGEEWYNVSQRDGAESDRLYAFKDGIGVLAYNNERGLVISDNLSTWHDSVLGEDFSLPFIHKDIFFRRNYIDEKFYKSVDGVIWELADEVPEREGDLTHLASANGVIFAFNNGLLVGLLGELNQWQSPLGNVEGVASGLRFEDGKYILPTSIDSADLESANGLTWSARSLLDGQYFSSAYVSFQNALFAVSNQGVIRSENGIDWEAVDQELFSEYVGTLARFYAFSDSLYLADGRGDLFSTLDGENWSLNHVVNKTGDWVSQMVEFNGQILAIASKGQIYQRISQSSLSPNLTMSIESESSLMVSASASDPNDFLVLHEKSLDLKNWQTTELVLEGDAELASKTIGFSLNDGENAVFHRAMIHSHSGLGGIWTGTVETNIIGEGGCSSEFPATERVSFLFNWMADNKVVLDQFQAGAAPVYGVFNGSFVPDIFEVLLTRELSSNCQATANCDVSISSKNESGLEMIIRWTEPVCGEPACEYERILRLTR